MQNNAIHFAPLQGYTDAIYRNAHARVFAGVACYYTPFVRIEKGTFRNKELRELSPEANRTNLVPQLIAGTADELRTIASLFIENGYTRADINMGCSFPLQARKHKGAGLLPYPNEMEALLRVIEELPELRFSVKLRLGWDNPKEGLALLLLLNSLPLKQIAVHARLGIQQYKGAVDLAAFEQFYAECTHPLFYNGDINTVEDYRDILDRFPNLQGVMIGRGLLSNPFLADECRGTVFTGEEKRGLLTDFHQELFDKYKDCLQGDHQLLSKLHTLWEYLLPDADKRLRKKISKTNRIDSYLEAVQTLLKQYIRE